jgi:acetyltransferase-like isoleucine patch superfamily enzyme
MNYLDIAKGSIEHFSLDSAQYTEQGPNSSFTLSGNFSDNSILVKQPEYAARFRINFNNTKGCKVFIGNQIGGDISINFNGDNSTVYIGDNSDLNQLEIRSRQAEDFVAIGEEVSVAGRNVWVSGYGAGNHTPAIIVGDDCMFSYDIVIRNSDAHPVFDGKTDRQINGPHGAVHIEPHVWIGERSNILKDTTVGACSIIALGSTVTRDAPRFSVIKGAPAEAAVQENSYWARDYSEFAIDQAKYYSKKYSL